MEKPNSIFAPSDQELAMLKSQFPRLHTIVVTDEETGNEYHFIVKPVDRIMLSAALHIGKDDSLAGAHVLATNTIVWGNVQLLEDAAYLIAFSSQQQKLMQNVTATLKKN